jgi:hypothetical protein
VVRGGGLVAPVGRQSKSHSAIQPEKSGGLHYAYPTCAATPFHI